MGILKKPQFKVGDIVTIRHDLKQGDDFSIYVNEDMEKLRCKKATIVSINKEYEYTIDLSDDIYLWTDDMFEEYRSDIEFKKPETKVKTFKYFKTRMEFEMKCNGVTSKDAFMIPERNSKMIFSNNAVICILDDGSKGVSKCSPDDNYHETTGVKIAYTRAKIKSLQKELKKLTK